jgi:hypothetical protein
MIKKIAILILITVLSIKCQATQFLDDSNRNLQTCDPDCIYVPKCLDCGCGSNNQCASGKCRSNLCAPV